MAKADFCFTYYDGDAARDMAHMNRLERGAYSDIIISQRNFGHLTKDQIKKILGRDFDECWGSIELILKKDQDEKFFIEWLDESVNKREAYTISRRRNKTNAKNGQSYLYLIQDSVTGYTKIGISLEPKLRISEIDKYEREPLLKERKLTLIWSSDLLDKTEESKIHKKFLNKRVFGEWFNLTEQDITYICRSCVIHKVNEYGNGDDNGNEFELNYKSAFDEIYIDQLAMKFKGIDLNKELSDFRFKCDSAPTEYHCRDRDGLRLGFLAQLKNTWLSNTKVNGTKNKVIHDLK